MKLVRLRIRNFRCYRAEVCFDFDDITALIGRNDAGKSSVMDALDIFLNDGSPDKHDANKGGDSKDLTLICEFSDLPSSAVIDEYFATSLQAEHLLNAGGRLEIHKTYSGHTAAPKCSSISAYALHPTADGAADLLQLKNADLKRRARELNVDLQGIDLKVNAQIRGRIREAVGDLRIAPVLVPLNEENAKKAWDGIKAYVPTFALFKSDRASTDQDPEAQDPLKTAVKEAIKQKEAELNAIACHVEAEVRKIADATLEKLKEMDPALAQQLKPEIVTKKWDTLFNVSITGDEDVPINKRGSGVKRLVLLNFFRAKVEQLSRDRATAPVLYGVEEPETSQHPHNQRMLVSALMDLAEEHQVIVTTHTPMLARTLPDKCLRFIHEKPDKSREVLAGGPATNQLFVRSLGVLPDNDIKVFVGVEGRHDITFLKNIGRVLRASGLDVLDLERMELDGELIFFPLGGSSLALWTSRLAPLGRPEFHLFDRDDQPPAQARYQTEADQINRRERCKAVITGKREIENYLHHEAINEAYSSSGMTLRLAANFSAFDDVPMRVAEQIHQGSQSETAWTDLDAKKQAKKVAQAKAVLCDVASKMMTRERLNDIDPEGHVVSWFEDMRVLANG